jgi:hypothetical protein
MEDYPRKLMDLRGGHRWQGRSGRTYPTREEAEADDQEVIEAALKIEPAAEKTKEISWASALLQTFFSAGAMIGLGRAYLNGESISKYEWVDTYVLPFGGFMLIGVLLQGLAEIWALATGRKNSVKPEEISDAWPFFGCGCLVLLGVSFAASALVGNLASGIFEGVGKGTTIVIVLLFCILLALINLASKRR